MDEKKSKKTDKKSTLSKHDTKHFDYWKLKIENRIKEKCNELVKLAKSQGKDHLVLEDLGQFGESHVKANQFFGFKYSRLVKLLGLSNIKNIIKSIVNKNGIQVTFVQSYYTSKMCSKCGHSHKDNRKSQEIFKCVECGFEINADFGAALKIEDRLSVDVLRTSLLNKVEGLYIPKRISKQFIFNILYSYYNIRTNSNINEEMKFS